jgi:hypothetical protein
MPQVMSSLPKLCAPLSRSLRTLWAAKRTYYRSSTRTAVGRYLVTGAELAADGKPVPDDIENPLISDDFRCFGTIPESVLQAAAWVGTAIASGVLGNAAYDVVKSHFLKITRR